MMNAFKSWLKTQNDDILFATVIHTPQGSGNGFYGLGLKGDVNRIKKPSTNCRAVEKVESETNRVLEVYPSIAKAATAENMYPCYMSTRVRTQEVIKPEGQRGHYFRAKPRE
jgi:hypothetical protein